MEEKINVWKTRIDHRKVKAGDIVLSTTTAAVSTAIRAFTRSDISHAMLCVETGSVIDATDEGVQARNIQRMNFEPGCNVYVLRLRNPMSTEQLAAVTTFVRGRIGTEYTVKEAIQTVLGGGEDFSRKQFCSRLVAQAFASAGIKLVDDPNFCSPADLKNSDQVDSVADVVLQVTPEDAAFWERKEDTPQLMRDATNQVLDAARKLDAGVQSFDDLHRHLLAHPEHDDHFCRALKSSGYLTLWELEKAENPWMYDYNLMANLPSEATEAYCQSVLTDEGNGPNRYVTNRAGYAWFAARYQLRFFDLMLRLYNTLTSLHRKRVDVATQWLESHRNLAPQIKPVLRPHTPQWFTALELWDPNQAGHTRSVIEAAGSSAVCSICGDTPAKDYRLGESDRPPYGVDTFRLCRDCFGNQVTAGQHLDFFPEESAGQPSRGRS
jgi:hypothetical protein